MIGVVLALLNFIASGFYSSRIVTQSKMTSVVLVLLGFIGRLTMIGIIFYGLTKVKWIHFQASLITFVIFFTLCAIWKATRVYREAKPLVKQQTEM
jgi:membrane protein YdbS with pleckstrin-like domain